MTQPQTPIYGLPYEKFRGDEPGRTLNSGSSGTSPILAEEVEDELARIDNDVASLTSTVTSTQSDLSDAKWRHIGRGIESGAAFSITVPAGFDMLRLYLLGDLDGEGTVRLRINDDSTAGLHNTGFLSRRPDTGALVDNVYSNNATAWFLANWGTVSGNTCEVRIMCPNASGAPSYRSWGERYSSSAAGHLESTGWGNLDADRTVSSLSVRPFSNVSNLFATCHWWLEGRLLT